jgi:predicted dehydrogenase
MSTPSSPLHIALIGCGQIADAHLQELAKVTGAQVVSVCDLHQDLADQAAARFDIPHACSDLNVLFNEIAPDVVHITTPAQTHAPLAKQALQAGCHVYVEKPFTLDTAEADEVIATANQTDRKLCLGHDQLFDPIWHAARERIAAGDIGVVRHVESTFGYPIAGNFGRAITADPHHWVRQLPGGLFQNTMSHPLYRITEFVQDESPEIIASWHRLRHDFPTELSLTLRGAEVTGNLTFHSQITSQRSSRIYGEKGCLTVDFDAQTIRREGPPRLPGAFGKLEVPYRQWREGARNFRRNVWRFLKSDIHYFAGMRELFERFYRAIREDAPLPISTTEMRRVTKIMDDIFHQCRSRDDAPINRQNSPLKREVMEATR